MEQKHKYEQILDLLKMFLQKQKTLDFLWCFSAGWTWKALFEQHMSVLHCGRQISQLNLVVSDEIVYFMINVLCCCLQQQAAVYRE